MTITEADIEFAVLDWLAALGWQVAHGRAIASDTPGAERGDYGQVVLEGRLRDAHALLNQGLRVSAVGQCKAKLEVAMATKRVFISFDYDHDNDLRGNLVSQAKRPDSPFSIKDQSVQARIDEKWRDEVRSRIRRSDLVVIICGEYTHIASGVAAEVTITQEEKKPYFLLKGRRQKQCSRPTTVPKKKAIHPWTWPQLKELIANPR